MLKKIYLEITSALRSKTGKNTQLALLTQLCTATLGYALNIFLIRRMSVSDYGTFALFSSVLMLLSGLIHLGWIESYVRFGAEYSLKPESKSIERFFFKRIFLYSLVLSLITLFFTAPICEKFYHRKDFSYYFILGVGGAFFTSLYNGVLGYFRAHQLFKYFTLWDTSSSLFRISLCFLGVCLGLPLLRTVSFIYLSVPLLGIAAFLLMYSISFKKRDSENVLLEPELSKKFRSYNAWIVVSWITVHLIGNIDSQFVAHYHSNSVVAAFAAVGRLTLPIHFIIRAIYTTVLPRLSQTQSLEDIKLYLRKIKYFLIPIGALLAASCWFLPPLLIWIAGSAYQDTTFLIQMQLVTVLVDFLCTPISVVLYVFGWSKGFAILNFIQLCVFIVLNLIWVPRFGAVGAVYSRLAVNLIGMVYIYWATFYHLRKSSKDSSFFF